MLTTTKKTLTAALIALGLTGGMGAAKAKPKPAPPLRTRPATATATASPAQIDKAGQAYSRLTYADGQLDNFKSRGPVAAQELKALLKTKTNPKNTQVLQSLQITLKDLMTKAKPAQVTTRNVEKQFPFLKSGKMSYESYKALLKTAEASHQAVLSSANVYTQAYKKLPANSLVANKAVNSRSMANYCEVYAAKMASFESACGQL